MENSIAWGFNYMKLIRSNRGNLSAGERVSLTVGKVTLVTKCRYAGME